MGLPQLPESGICPVCREERWTVGWVESPLPGIRVGGYGEATRLELTFCGCGVRERLRQAVNPR